MICTDVLVFVLLFRRHQGRKEAFEQRKRELKALGLGQDGRPIKKEDENKEVKSRGKVCQVFASLSFLPSCCFVEELAAFAVGACRPPVLSWSRRQRWKLLLVMLSVCRCQTFFVELILAEWSGFLSLSLRNLFGGEYGSTYVVWCDTRE